MSLWIAESKALPHNGDGYWHAVLARDARYDGAFVYAVDSTGIYCRPSCPSRKPERKHVRFFPSPQAAREAGYRPCVRCRPDKPERKGECQQRLEAVCRYIDRRLEDQGGANGLSLPALAAVAGIRPHSLKREFKRALGISPRQYAEARRLERFKARIQNGAGVTEAMYEAGYGSSSRLYERAHAQLGMTPAAYRKGGFGMSIRYTITDSPLGRLLLAATDRGICRVALGDSDIALEAALRGEYPRAIIRRETNRDLQGWLESVLRHLRGELKRLELPTDILATAFERRVWQELQAIPYGSTRSYAEVAQAIGRPKAVRAVARACATNPVALVVPCHRVVRKDGSLGGYRWGLERKRALLAAEQAAKPERPRH